MKNYKLLIGVFLILILGRSCRFQQEIEVTPHYFVIQVDDVDDKDLCYKLYDGNYLGLLGGGLLNLYQKGDTLIAIKAIKREKKLYKEYYIIPMHINDTLDPSVGIKGPLNKTELKSNGFEINRLKEINIGY